MKYSKRAALLERVLGYINTGDYDASGEFLVFGKEAFERYTGESQDEKFGFEDPLRELLSDAKVKWGKDSVHKRISLKMPTKGFTEADSKRWKEFSSSFPDFSKNLAEALSNDAAAFEPVANEDSVEFDDRDAALALEALKWLDDAAGRLEGLDELASRVGSDDIEQYFEEAHKCDLAGLKIATAVLCRAVLEETLKRVVDPNKKIENKKQNKDSYIELMLREANRAGKLGDDRVKLGLRIRDAGNDAIHKPQRFRKNYSICMNEIVDHTRTIIEDLLPPRP